MTETQKKMHVCKPYLLPFHGSWMSAFTAAKVLVPVVTSPPPVMVLDLVSKPILA